MSSREQRRREIRRIKREGSAEFIEVPKSEWTTSFPQGLSRLFRNNEYIVFIYDRKLDPYGYLSTKVMVRHNTTRPVGWAELQKIKNEIFGKEILAAQYLSPESQLVDDANLYWFFIREKSEAAHV